MSLTLLFPSSSAASYTLTAETGTIAVHGQLANFGLGRVPQPIVSTGGGGSGASIWVSSRRRRRVVHTPMIATAGSIAITGHDATFTIGARDELWVLGLHDIEEAA